MKKNYISSFKKPWRFLFSFLILFLCCGFLAKPQPMIELDGDPADWTTILTWPISKFVVDLPQDNDNQFTQGTKDGSIASQMVWSYSPVGDKVNLVNGGAAIGSDGYLYFFGDRTSRLGSAEIGFWVFQNGTSPDDPGFTFSPEKMDGDLLILSSFTNGGGVSTIEVYKWELGANKYNLVMGAQDMNNKAYVNDQTYPVPVYPGWAYCNKENKDCGWYYPGTFFEGRVNLNGLLSPEQLCKATWILETRQSHKLDAMLGDFIAGSFNITPDPPQMAGDAACGPNPTLTLSVSDPQSGVIYNWYDNENAEGSAVHTGESWTKTFSATTTYWVTAADATLQVCESAPTAVTGEVWPTPTAGDSHTNVLCFGGNDGTVTLTFSGGTPPYMVNFNGGGFVTQTSPKTYEGLIAATYSWVVKDANGCMDSGSETVEQPADITASDDHVNVKCFGGADGSVTLTFSGGTPPYMVNFNDGGFVTQTSPKTYEGLIAGTYTWVVRDANMCWKEGSETVEQPTDILASDAHVNVKCFGGADGTVTLTFSGGTPPYMVNFNGGGFVTQTSPKTYEGLAAGTYTWVVRDANMCWKEGSETVEQPTDITATDDHVNVKCYGGSDGTVTLAFSGGTPPYMVNFNGGGFLTQTSPKTYEGLTAGTYTWVVRDANMCWKEGSETIEQPPVLSCVAVELTPAVCNTVYGSATVNPSGGTPPYTYLWSDGQTTQTAVDLLPGMYTVKVTDYNLCETTCGVEVTYIPCACQTAYAMGTGATCFIPDFSQWGWTNLIGPGSYNWPLYASAANCDISKAFLVGNVDVVYAGGYVNVTFNMAAGYSLDDQHVYVGYSMYPTGSDGSFTVAPGQYKNIGPFTVNVYVIVHGVVCGEFNMPQAALTPDPVSLEPSDLKVYPNPFNTRVTFEFVSGKDANARLDIFNMLGQKVTTLLDRPVEKGVLNRIEYLPDVAPSVLFYRFTLDNEIFNGKLIYNK